MNIIDLYSKDREHFIQVCKSTVIESDTKCELDDDMTRRIDYIYEQISVRTGVPIHILRYEY